MKIAKSYTIPEFLGWTRRRLAVVAALAIVPVVLYQVLGQKWIAAPWAVAVVLGTATSFIMGFRNQQTYARSMEALATWTTIAAVSRYWGLIARDLPTTPEQTRTLILRHLAWLTVLRYRLRDSSRAWEAADTKSNAEYRRHHFTVPERETPLATALQPFLSEDEHRQVMTAGNKAGLLMNWQSATLHTLYATQKLAVLHHTEMQKTLKDLLDHQGKVERIKNYPYPRQYAAINTIFVWVFVAVLPFCLIREFDRLNEGVTGWFAGNMVWLAVPFSILIAWIYVSLDQVGESTENPFEGGANDTPMAEICRGVEGELRGVLGEVEVGAAAQAKNEVVL